MHHEMPTREWYAPYDRFPEFDYGCKDYERRALRTDLAGVHAQAYDRGAEFAMRVATFRRLAAAQTA